MRSVVLGVAGLVLAGAVWSFPFEVDENLGGLEVEVQTSDLGDNSAAVSLLNYGQVAAQCRVRFRSGPGVPVTRSARLEAGQRAHLSTGFNHQVIRMRVAVQCKPAKVGKR